MAYTGGTLFVLLPVFCMAGIKTPELDVPSKVQIVLRRVLLPDENVWFLIKTLWKPSATIPILWLAVTDRRCVLFSSLRGGQIFKDAEFASINSASSVGDLISVLMNEPSDDWRLQIDAKYRARLPALVEMVNSLRRRSS